MRPLAQGDHASNGPSGGRPDRLWLATLILALILIAALAVAYEVGSRRTDRNAARAVAIFTIGVVSFLGMLTITHHGSGRRRFDSSEVRVAVTTAFAMVYFAILGIFLFSTNELGTFAQGLVANLTSLFGVVVGFYFAASAAVEYGRVRGARERSEGGIPAESDETGPNPGPGSVGPLEEEVRALREMVGTLMAERSTRPPRPPGQEDGSPDVPHPVEAEAGR